MAFAVAAWPAIARSAAVTGETFARERLVHHPEYGLAKAHQANQRAPSQHARNKRFRSVDGIKHPNIFGVGVLGAVLLAEDAVIGKLLADQRTHGLLGRAVCCRNRVEAASFLVLDCQRGAEERENCFARGGRELVDESAEVDGRHAACPLSVFGLSKSFTIGNHLGPDLPMQTPWRFL